VIRLLALLHVALWVLGGVLGLGFLLGIAFAMCFPWVRRRIERAGGAGTPRPAGVRIPITVEPDPAIENLRRHEEETADALRKAGVSEAFLPPTRARSN
jgi:hypothetical protein